MDNMVGRNGVRPHTFSRIRGETWASYSHVVAEVIAYGNRQSRFGPLFVVQALVFLWALAHFVVFSIEASGSQSSNLWIVMILWWVIGFMLVLVGQTLASYLHTRLNHIPNTKDLSRLGRPQFREIVVADTVSILVYLLVGILLAVWLGQHRSGECCTKRDVDPETETQAFVSRFGIMTICALASMFLLVVHTRVLLVHMWPVTTVTHIIRQENADRQMAQRRTSIRTGSTMPVTAE